MIALLVMYSESLEDRKLFYEQNYEIV